MNALLSEALQDFTGLLKQLLTNLLGNDAGVWGNEFKKFLRKEPCWANSDGLKSTTSTKSKTQPAPLLVPAGTVNVAAITAPFTARDRFVKNTKKNASVKVSYLGDNFSSWFLDKTEEPFTGSTLKYCTLSKYSSDTAIIVELGGEEKAETTLTEMFSLMAQQPNGEKGVLLNDGYANIFYIRDGNGVLRTVYVRWRGGGWYVLAGALDGLRWLGGGRFFSRNS